MPKKFRYNIVTILQTPITSEKDDLTYEELRELVRESDAISVHDDLQGGDFEMVYVNKTDAD